MNKDNILYAIIGLLAGVIIGYVATSRINQSVPTVSANANQTAVAPSGNLPATGLAPDNASQNSANAAQPNAAGGVKWTPPARWKARTEEGGMRLVTYQVPVAGGDTEEAECPVFYFGPGAGGGIQQNIDRWIGQFKQPDGSASAKAARQNVETINGFRVTTVDLTGTFSGGGMMGAASSGEKPGWRLLGAIVEGPEGAVFFKLIGPGKTISAAQNEFQSLLKSLAKA
jgi:hypothetical protein